MSETRPFQHKAGYCRGVHHSDYMVGLKGLLLAHAYALAKPLLEELIDAIEAENCIEQLGVDFWYYQQLATIYHLEGNEAAETAVLERYRQQPGNIPSLCAAQIAQLRATDGRIAPFSPLAVASTSIYKQVL